MTEIPLGRGSLSVRASDNGMMVLNIRGPQGGSRLTLRFRRPDAGQLTGALRAGHSQLDVPQRCHVVSAPNGDITLLTPGDRTGQWDGADLTAAEAAAAADLIDASVTAP